MTSQRTWTILIGCTALVAACGPGGADTSPAAVTDSSDPTTCPSGGDEWEVAKIYIEHNATDEDTGIHGLLGGGEPWLTVCVTAPDGTQLCAIGPSDRLGQLGGSELFWEAVTETIDGGPVDITGYQVIVTDDEAGPRSHDDGGAGLGLAIVAEVVAAQGGAVTITDSPLGGAAVTMLVPVGTPSP